MMKPLKKTSIAGYVRVSSAKQVEGESLDDQKRSIQKYVDAHGHSLYKIYADEGVSGAKTDRPAIKELKNDAEKGLFQKIVFSCLDRFGRSAQDTLTNYEFFEKRGIALYSIKEGVDTSTPVGRLTRTVLAAIAEMERERIKERVIVGLVGRANDGKPIGKVTFGYRWDKEQKAYVVKAEEAQIYKTIVDLFLNRNKSLLSIAKTINEKGYRTRYEKKWTQTSLGKVLRNPFYLGLHKLICQGKEYEFPTPPLIDKKRWELIQERIRENIRKSKNFNPNTPFILRGLLKCGECGYGLVPIAKDREEEGDPYRYYRCYVANLRPAMRSAKNFEPGKDKCDLPSVNAENIESYILGSILSYFTFPEKLIDLWNKETSIDEKKKLESQLRSDRIKLGNFESRRQKLMELYLDGEIDKEHLKKQDATFKESIERFKEGIKELEGKIYEMGIMSERLNDLKAVTNDLKKLALALKEAIKKMTNQQQREFVEAALAGNKISVRILRRGDVVDSVKGLSPKQLYEPVYKTQSGRKILEWATDEGRFDLVNAANYLKPLVKEYNTKLGLS